jgi:flagellar assembly factor FliW
MIVSVRKRRASSRGTRTPATPQPQPPAPHTLVQLPAEAQGELTFPDGLLGLPTCRRFILSHYKPADGSPSPFFMLECQDEDVSFPLIDPRLLVADYSFSLAADILTYLKATTVEEISTLAIVTVRDRVEDITMNLQGPLVMNFHTRLGLQLVLEHFPVRYPLFVQVEAQRAAAK